MTQGLRAEAQGLEADPASVPNIPTKKGSAFAKLRLQRSFCSLRSF